MNKNIIIRNPKISVLMPVYNGEQFLKEAINSILNQSFKNFEFIIINDGSGDKTEEIINSFKDGRIKYIENKKNIGLTKSLNIGIKEARGKYLSRMDADDIGLIKKLEIQYNFLENNTNIGIVGSAMFIIDDNGKVIGKSRKPVEHYLIKWRCFFGYPMAHPTIMGRTGIFKENLYNEMFISSQDTELWSRLIFEKNIIFTNINQCLHKYRVHSSSIVARRPTEQREKSIGIAINNINRYMRINSQEDIILKKFFLNEYNIFDIQIIYNLYKKLVNIYIKKDKLNSKQSKMINRKNQNYKLSLYKKFFEGFLRRILKI